MIQKCPLVIRSDSAVCIGYYCVSFGCNYYLVNFTSATLTRKTTLFFFDRVDSIHAASFKVWNTWKYKMRSVRGQTSLERSAFSLPPHMNEPILTVAAERTSQLLPNHRFLFTSPQHIETQHIICFDDSLHHHLGTPLGRWIH